MDALSVMLGGALDLFRYNRAAFQFDVRQNQERLYHLQKMRNEQGKLFRQDLRDLFGLTVSKMETYLIVATLTCLLTIVLIYEGHVPESTPAWLFLLWAASCTAAVTFLLLSQWFAIHASIAAQVGRTQVLTSFVRLPVPSLAEVNAAALVLEEFETSGASLRVPFLDSPGPDRNDEDPDESSHFDYFTRLQADWMGYDAYARVSLIVGTNQMLLALGYTGIAHFAASNHIHVYWAFMAVLVSFGAAHAYMNLLVRYRTLVSFTLVFLAAPALACTTYAVYATRTPFPEAFYVLSSGAILCQLGSLAFFVLLALDVDRNWLPINFATVQQIDIVGVFGLVGCERELAPAATIPAAPIILRTGTGAPPVGGKSEAFRSFKFIGASNLLILLAGFIYSVLVASGAVSAVGWDNAPVASKETRH